MLTDKGKQIIEATYRIANRSLQYLTMTLPEGTDLWGVYSDGKPIKAAEDDGRILLPIFSGKPTEPLKIKILAYRRTGSFLPFGSKKIELPVLDVGANRVNLNLYLPEQFSFFGFGGKLRLTQKEPISTAKVPDKRAAVSGAEGADMGGLAKGGKIAAVYDSNIADDKGVTFLFREDIDIDEDIAAEFSQLEGKAVDRNIQYRVEQSQVQKQAADIPVKAVNVDYIGAMARGALSVKFDVSWEGKVYNLATLIVDPGEKTFVRFFYNRRFGVPCIKLFVILLSALVGYLLVKSIIARRHEAIKKPSRTSNVLSVLGLILLIALVIARVSTLSLVFLGLVIGAIVMLFRWRGIKREAELKVASELIGGQSQKLGKEDDKGGSP